MSVLCDKNICNIIGKITHTTNLSIGPGNLNCFNNVYSYCENEDKMAVKCCPLNLALLLLLYASNTASRTWLSCGRTHCIHCTHCILLYTLYTLYILCTLHTLYTPGCRAAGLWAGSARRHPGRNVSWDWASARGAVRGSPTCLPSDCRPPLRRSRSRCRSRHRSRPRWWPGHGLRGGELHWRGQPEGRQLGTRRDLGPPDLVPG